MIKKILKILLVVLILVVCFLFWALNTVDYTPYFKSDYYATTKARLDSIATNPGVSRGQVQLGFGRKSITPTLLEDTYDPAEGKFVALPLSGYGGREGMPATGIHDSLFVKAMAVKVNEKIMVFIGSDLLIMPPEVSKLSITAVEKEIGLTQENIFYSATHTHSSVGAWSAGRVGELFAGEYNPDVVSWLSQQVAKTIIEAVKNLQPGKIGVGNFHARQFVKNRLVGDDGVVNDDFLMIVAEQLSGTRAILGSFDAHATTLGDWNMEFSADYPGYWQRKLETNGFDMAMFFAGSVGSHSYQSQGERFEKSRYIGEALADSTIKYSQEIITKDSITTASLTLKIDYPELQIRVSDGLCLNPVIARSLFPDVGDVYLQTIRLDSLIWTTTPSDFSGETALTYKNVMYKKGFRAMVTSFNGAYTGYIIPCKYYHLNAYESRMMNWFGPGYNPFINYMIGELIEKVSSAR
ncbi:neutral/alkaline non-lysosomal ceramidase N-terminal domain-containing protein [Fulvivirgaceae bacterium BMA12]|uniref:Neutral/alkaline non-lysosomal ceramidase N-terminal domain-containing protein n=1 Tax=Agaribacillus aureus TaxID=3051825 RepID=A0ABT8L0Q7_9BACT|nr:neutral/alkaline non-lysosomal ceramidase N-terminal domain-containing protein [Fulvivirgaceae bacterium BMA12]